MHFHASKASFIMVVAAFVVALPARAGAVRVSFLNDADSCTETIGALTNVGCGQEATSVFRRVVENYYEGGFNLDLSKFPKSQSGFYVFPTMTDVVKALPHRLCDTEHSWDFNCCDAVIVLAHGKLQIGLRPDDNFGPFMVSTMLTKGDEAITFAATARDAFSLIYAQWYRDTTESIIPKTMQDARIGLTAVSSMGLAGKSFRPG